MAPSTVIAASTGPAHGTNTRPKANPMTKPPLELLGWRPTNRAKGRSSHSPRTGTTKPSPTRPKSTIPVHINVLWGRCSPERISEPASTRRLKLKTRPSTIATERRHEPLGFAAASGAAAPATNTMGRTGKMQGEMPAISPAAKATTISVTVGATLRGDPTNAVEDPLFEL